MKIEEWPIDAVHPSKNNPRQHPPAQIDELVRWLEKMDWTRPILVDEKKEVLAGHGILMAARQMGLKTVPVLQRFGLTEAVKKAYRIADNRLGELSEWENRTLAGEMAALAGMGFDMSLTGFNPAEIEFMLKPPVPPASEPPAAKLQERTVSRLGDVWTLGEHRIICADATKPATYKALLGGRQAQCVFTDPPYGISYEAKSGKFEVISGDNLRRGQLSGLIQGAFSAALPHVREDAGWYVWHASGTRTDFATAMAAVGLVELCLIVWEKPGATLGWGDYRQAHEPCFYAARQGVKPQFHGDRSHTTIWRLEAGATGKDEPVSVGGGLILVAADGQELYVSASIPKGRKLRHLHIEKGKATLLQPKTEGDDLWQVGRDYGHGKDDAIHPTMKPVELARRALRNSTREGEGVLDMFSGSGSTLMAAEQTKRVAYAAELDPHYVDATVRRWQTLTGQKATHGEEKKTFDAIAKARGKG
ncbi:MAG TPA: DNA methyltransferase [Gemmatimonadales bacterium]